MMTPKEKAQELFNGFYKEIAPDFETNDLAQEAMHSLYDDIVKKCALIALEREIKLLEDLYEYKLGDSYIWQKLEEAKEVKNEIEKL